MLPFVLLIELSSSKAVKEPNGWEKWLDDKWLAKWLKQKVAERPAEKEAEKMAGKLQLYCSLLPKVAD